MKKLAIIVFVAVAVLAPTSANPAPAHPEVAALEGQGILGSLGCAACIGAAVTSAGMGFGPFYLAIINVWDGALRDACTEACAF